MEGRRGRGEGGWDIPLTVADPVRRNFILKVTQKTILE